MVRTILVAIFLSFAAPAAAQEGRAAVTFETFHEALSPHGEWVDIGGHGRCWRPTHVAVGWQPYYFGYWVWTDDGWFWMSDEPWGWGPYHYGRWLWDPVYGWVWVPGYEWAPAWVLWRYDAEDVGWYPMEPGMTVWVEVHPPHHRWIFVPSRHFAGERVHTHAHAPERVPDIYHRTSPAPPPRTTGPAPGPGPTPAPPWGGPPRATIEQRSGQPLPVYRVDSRPTPKGMPPPDDRERVVPAFRPPAPGPARPPSPERAPPPPERAAPPVYRPPPERAVPPARREGPPAAPQAPPPRVQPPPRAEPRPAPARPAPEPAPPAKKPRGAGEKD